MNYRGIFLAVSFVILLVLIVADNTSSSVPGDEKQKSEQIKRGEYLVALGGCNDCHSPKVFTQMGPMPDTTKILSGYPADSKLPDVPEGVLGPQQWGALVTNDLTGWVGPWGTSFSRNLTPDPATGLGSWTEEMFVKTIRTGKHMGEGRMILPPMPWQEYAKMTDEDLKAVFAYLQSIPPVENSVPDPISPMGDRIPTTTPAKKVH